MTDTATTDDRGRSAALPGDGLREGIVDELRRRSARRCVDTELRPNDDLWVRVATDAWRRAGEALRDDGLRLLLLPVGDRLDAVAVRPGRGRPDRAAARAHDRDRPGRHRRRDPLPGVRPRRRPAPPRRRHAQGRRPRRHADGRLVVHRLRRRQLARAGDPRDVRHRLRRPPRPAQHVPAGRLRGATRCARTSRCSPGWSSRGPASSTSSRCRPRTRRRRQGRGRGVEDAAIDAGRRPGRGGLGPRGGRRPGRVRPHRRRRPGLRGVGPETPPEPQDTTPEDHPAPDATGRPDTDDPTPSRARRR